MNEQDKKKLQDLKQILDQLETPDNPLQTLQTQTNKDIKAVIAEGCAQELLEDVRVSLTEDVGAMEATRAALRSSTEERLPYATSQITVKLDNQHEKIEVCHNGQKIDCITKLKIEIDPEKSYMIKAVIECFVTLV